MADLIPILAPWSGRVLTMAAVVLGLSLMARALWRRRHPGPRCPRCRYDLSATPLDRPCPECGARSTRAARARMPRRWRLAVIGLLIALSLPVYVAQRRMRRFGWDYYLKLYPLYAVWPLRKIERVEVGAVTVTVWRSRRLDMRTLLVVRHGSRVIGRIDGQWGYDIYAPADPRLGLPEDINGDGIADAVIEASSFGAHCCATLAVVSIADHSAWLTTIVSGSDANPQFADLDDDGIYEVETGDDTFLYWNNSYASSAKPRIVLAWDGARWAMSPAHMVSPAPGPDEIRALAAAHVQPPEYETSVWNSGLLYPVTDLIYSGNAATAVELARLAWQPRWHGAPDDFLAAIAGQLATSPYLDGLQDLNPGIDLATLTPR